MLRPDPFTLLGMITVPSGIKKGSYIELIYLLFLMRFYILFILISLFYLCNKGINSHFSCIILKPIILYRHKRNVIIIFSEFWDKTIYNQSWHTVKWNNTYNAI